MSQKHSYLISFVLDSASFGGASFSNTIVEYDTPITPNDILELQEKLAKQYKYSTVPILSFSKF